MLDFELLCSDYSPFDIVKCQFELQLILAASRVEPKATNAHLKLLDRIGVHDDPNICVLWCPCFLENRGNLHKDVNVRIKLSRITMASYLRPPDVFFLIDL
jgi:hypothetical protein